MLLRPAPLLSAILMGTCLCVATPNASAQQAVPKQLTSQQVQAEQHFQRARVLYKAGSYKEAIDELEKAHALDPAAKDLVLNLATVSEKIGQIDDALKYTREYEQLDLTATEKEHADAAIRRLEGAKKELDAQKAAQAQRDQQQVVPPPQPPPQQAESRPHGRLDVLTVGAAVIAVGGYAVGTVFGVKALSDKPAASGYVSGTGPGTNGTYADLQASADHSHSEARVADIAFIVGGVATIGAAVLYFARTRDRNPSAQPTDPATTAPGGASVSPTPDATSKKRPMVQDAWISPTVGGLTLGGSF